MVRRIYDTAANATVAAFRRIEEPRVVRLLNFLIYVVLGVTGLFVVISPPDVLVDVLGDPLTTSFGASLFVGGALGAISVLPGIWWVERLAIISLVSGLLMYLAASFSLDTSPVRTGIVVTLLLSFALRWIEVRRYQHAPGK